MTEFIQTWQDAVHTTGYFFYQAFWAFCLGYLISSMIQVFVTREGMRRIMGKEGAKSVALGGLFGFLSSSCSFAALATTKALLKKGAGLLPALTFLLASTNLVIELGIVIAIFLGWQFVLGEYLGGVLLILLVAAMVTFAYPEKLMQAVSKRLNKEEETKTSKESRGEFWNLEAWHRVAKRFFLEWKMVWKDVTFGFTVAGIIAAMVPAIFFQTLFPGAGMENPAWYQVVAQSFIGPLAAFFTFIGSMGNIPLAAVLYRNGVGFAGIMAFIFSDLMVFPVLRINAKYYGWKMALYIFGVLFVALILAALILHYSFNFFHILPRTGAVSTHSGQDISWNYTAYLNLFFVGVVLVLAFLAGTEFWREQWKQFRSAKQKLGKTWLEWAMSILALLSLVWLLAGLILG